MNIPLLTHHLHPMMYWHGAEWRELWIQLGSYEVTEKLVHSSGAGKDDYLIFYDYSDERASTFSATGH